MTGADYLAGPGQPRAVTFKGESLTGADGAMVPPGDPRAAIWDLIVGPWRFAALRALVQLGCADHLAAGPLAASDLAARCRARPGELARLLAWAASAGLVRQPEPGRYALTDTGQTLRADAPASMRPAVLATGDVAAWRAMTALEHTMRSGQPAFEAEHGCGFYDYLAAHPAAGQAFAAFMASRSARLATAIAALDFSASRVVADIGGGHGTILASVLAAWPHLRGILADRPEVLGEARAWLATAGVGARAEVVACDYLDPRQIPAADTYLLASILHNHDDTDAQAILGALAGAATTGPRLIVAEILLPDDSAPHIGYDLDIRMMALGRGRERTRAAYDALLTGAGQALTTITQGPGAFSIVDAQPAGHHSP